MRTRPLPLLVPILTAPLLAGCAFGFAKHAHREVYVPPSLSELGIPRGHLPPPGLCRIWLPGVPPGHQDRPAACRRVDHHVPPGGWLLHRVHHNLVELWVYDDVRPEVREIVAFDVRTGLALEGGPHGY